MIDRFTLRLTTKDLNRKICGCRLHQELTGWFVNALTTMVQAIMFRPRMAAL